MARKVPSVRRLNKRSHAIRRAYERYGIVLYQEDIEALERRIREGDVVRRVHKTRHSAFFVIEHLGVHMLAVYARIDKVIVTFFPMDWEESVSVYDDNYDPKAYTRAKGSGMKKRSALARAKDEEAA